MDKNDRAYFSQYIEQVLEFPWFQNCGNHYTPHLSIPTRHADRKETIASIQKSDSWDSFRITLKNEITDSMVDGGITQAPSWNDRAAVVRSDIENIIRPKVHKLAVHHDIPIDIVWPVIQWDLLHACMEGFFSHKVAMTDLYRDLVVVYEDGHLAGGWSGDPWPDIWDGDWPQGALLVW